MNDRISTISLRERECSYAFTSLQPLPEISRTMLYRLDP